MSNDFPAQHSEKDPPEGFASDLTRASLFARLAAGDSQVRELAWNEFWLRYSPIIAAFATRCGAERQEIDDIMQDVLAGFFGVSHCFDYDSSQGRFRGYLKTCTVRAAIRRAGKNLRFRGIPLDELPQAELAVEPLWNDVWEQQLIGRALLILRAECDNNLAFRAFEQYVLLDRAAADVSAELGTSVNNVQQSKSRMTKRLREIVQCLVAQEEE